MPIAIHGSTPAGAVDFSPVVSPSFSPPAGSLLVAAIGAYSSSPTISNSGTARTWTQRVVHGSVAGLRFYTAPNPTALSGITVTAGGTNGGLRVWVVTGQHPSSPIGTTGTGSTTTNNATATAYTSTAGGSRAFLVAIEGNSTYLAAPSSTDDEYAWQLSDASAGLAATKAANTATAGQVVTFNLDATGSATADWHWVALEILGASVDAEVTLTTVAVPAAMPAPAVSAGASAVPATIVVPTSMPRPATSAGASSTPATIAAAVAMPTPSVTTEDAEVVLLGTIAAATAMPTPAVQASSSAAPATIAAAAAMPTPVVQASAEVILSTIAVGAAMPRPVVSVPPLPGDRIVRAGQIEWNGFLLGSGTPYSWQELEGWRDSAPYISGNVDQPNANGSYPGQGYFGERILNWATLLKAPRLQVGQLLRDLQMATGRSQTEDEGALVIWDFDDAEPYLVYAHLSNRAPGKIDRNARLGRMRGGLQWICSGPEIFSVIRQSLPIPIDVETDVLNDGNEASPRVVYRIPGPCTTPQVENLTLDRVFGFDVDLADGEVLEIDVKYGNATVDGVDTLTTLIEGSTSVKDFVLGPGVNRLLWSAESGGTLMNVLWRHAST
ncbi:phage tail family protein [Streptosporangium sp. KLBMP 9127]|nr:phage tail family protein [Streptosporangium sp. KLBMP 9127]